MAITHVNTTAATSADGGTSPVSVAKPGSTANGDIMIAFIASNDGAVTRSGWTSFVAQSATATGNNFRLTILYRYVDGTEGAGPYVFTGSSGAPIGVVLSAYRGVASSSPFSIGSRSGSSAVQTTEPYAISSLSITGSGKAFAVRACRFMDTTNQPTTLIGMSDSDADTTYRGHARALSASNNTQYAVGVFDYGAQVDNGDSRSASISHDGPVPPNETDNLYAIFGLKMEGTPATGTVAMTTPAVTSTFAAERQIPTGVLGPMQIPAIYAEMDGIATPPSGSMSVLLPAVGAEMTGTHVGGSMNAGIPAIVAEMTGTHVGGSLTSSIPPVVAEVTGGVVVFGGFTSFIPMVVVDFVAESRSFGEHVINVEAEHRAFLVTDEGNGLIPIKRSNVTQV